MRTRALFAFLSLCALALFAIGCASTAAPTPTPTPEGGSDVLPVAGESPVDDGSGGGQAPAPTADAAGEENPGNTPTGDAAAGETSAEAEGNPDSPAGGGDAAPPPVVIALPDVAGVVERVSPAVVQVIATVPQTNIFGQQSLATSQGSGVFFDERGYILTNNHVVDQATEVEIVLASRERLEAEIVGVDPTTDLAVLRADPQEVSDLVVAPLGQTDAMRPGDWVIAIGSPLGFQGSVTVGVVSALGRSLEIDATTRLDDLLQTDAVINPGNSGGPLLNLQGEVIGINTAIIRSTQAEGIGFSISMETAVPVSTQLIENGRVIRPRMGVVIQDLTPASALERGLAVREGILVVALSAGGPAERAGIQVNDVIVQIDDTPVMTITELVRLLLTDYRVGDDVRVTVVRSEARLPFDIVLEEVV